MISAVLDRWRYAGGFAKAGLALAVVLAMGGCAYTDPWADSSKVIENARYLRAQDDRKKCAEIKSAIENFLDLASDTMRRGQEEEKNPAPTISDFFRRLSAVPGDTYRSDDQAFEAYQKALEFVDLARAKDCIVEKEWEILLSSLSRHFETRSAVQRAVKG